MVRKKVSLTAAFILFATALFAQSYSVSSPDGNITVDVTVNNGISYSASVDGKKVINASPVSLQFDQAPTDDWNVDETKKSTEDETLHPVVWQKSKTIDNHYNEFDLIFTNGLMLQWRLFDSGMAWRWKSDITGSQVVTHEQAAFNFVPGGKTWYPSEDGFHSHNERLYKRYALDSLTTDSLASLPVLTQVKGIKMLITESSLLDFPGLWVRGTGQGGLKGVHPHYPKETKQSGDRDMQVVSREDFIAKTDAPRAFPWRVVMVARDAKDLLTNQLPYKLAKPAEGDYNWVEPGKVAWDWWNGLDVYNVDFKAGINTATYKYYVDFAAKYGIQYILLDEGWSDTRDLLDVNPDIDMKQLTAYAKSKGVGVLLWCPWLALDRQMDKALDQFEQWGVKGIKVDFMQRDDQPMVNFYSRTAEEAAKRHLLVDFHGAYKPTGWLRTYPNILTSEGVFGNEQSSWTDRVTPTHNVTIPFIRMAAGPMDFTPGGMRNVHENAWAPVGREPMTIGTRANQLAMYVIYESPLQMLSDSPTHYMHAPKAMDFLSQVPVEWQQTIPLKAEVGDYVVMARQAPNGDWYIGAMTDEQPRSFNVSLSFLDEGNYSMQVWKDGVNADRNARDMAEEKIDVTNASTTTIDMERGGGWVAKISKN